MGAAPRPRRSGWGTAGNSRHRLPREGKGPLGSAGTARRPGGHRGPARPARGLRVPVPLVPGRAARCTPALHAACPPAGPLLTRRSPSAVRPYLLEGGERAAERPGHATRPGQHRGGGGGEGGRTPDMGPTATGSEAGRGIRRARGVLGANHWCGEAGRPCSHPTVPPPRTRSCAAFSEPAALRASRGWSS